MSHKSIIDKGKDNKVIILLKLTPMTIVNTDNEANKEEKTNDDDGDNNGGDIDDDRNNDSIFLMLMIKWKTKTPLMMSRVHTTMPTTFCCLI